MAQLDQRILKLVPEYRERVWGGQRLKAANPPIGEAWIAYGPSVVADGPAAGKTIDELIALDGVGLLGSDAARRYDSRFPLLIKFLDCKDWLSVQVHPNDEQARRLVGPNEFGKTEAWYFLEAEPGARILAGVKPGVSAASLAAAIRNGKIVDVAEQVDIHDGEALLIPAGTLHALGPGLLLYEIQQASDTTYRAYDWDRPLSTGRKLHIEESVAVTTTDPACDRARPEIATPTGSDRAVSCDYFDLDLARVTAGEPLRSTTQGRGFHIVSVVDANIEIACGDEAVRLGCFETAIVAGSAGDYTISAQQGSARLLRATTPN